MIIGIGSTNRVKVEAVREAIDRIQKKFPFSDSDPVRLEAMTTRTSVPDMPLTQQDMRQGALERALFVFEDFKSRGIRLHFSVGLEGGVYAIGQKDQVFLQNWVYAFDGTRGFFGSSASLPLPENVYRPLFEQGVELAEVIDRVSGQTDVRSNNGAFGILTSDIITRRQAFTEAAIAALIPFFNKTYYR